MGAPNVVMGGMATCSFGMAPASLVAIPEGPPVMIGGRPALTIMDKNGMVNIPTFGVCSTLSNPTVAAATAAALGVLTPMPCIPVVPGPWMPQAPQTLINGSPALVSSSQCLCTWGGVITITMPGQMQTESS